MVKDSKRRKWDMIQYENFKFLLKWDGRVVAAVNKISVIKRTTQPIKNDKQGNEDLSSRFHKKKNHPALVLKGGVSHDPEFEKWANEAPNHLRKDIIIHQVIKQV